MRSFATGIIHASAIAGALLFPVSCTLSPGGRPVSPEDRRPGFQLICMIHGDASYSFHDKEGRRLQADEEALSQALEVAAEGLNAEIFIFHQRPARYRFFRPVKNGTLYHYRFGRRVLQEPYFRHTRKSGESREAELFRRYSLFAPVRFFTYFGHEIPEKNGRGYSGSYPQDNFSLHELSLILKEFSVSGIVPENTREKPFALIMLSTCKGGGLATVKALSPFADFIVASPGDLHLSYFDSRAFTEIIGGPAVPFGKAESKALGSELTRRSFEGLKKSTQTEITVGLWATEKAPGGTYASMDDEGSGAGELLELHHQPPRFGNPRFAPSAAETYRRRPNKPTSPIIIK